MKLLKEKGLHGSGLLEVASAQMVDRYNDALVSMGFQPTTLKRFSVDMLGWSPEIATEKNNIYYLTHSLANPMGIIININQRDSSVYFPYHSFDRAMLSAFYSRFAAEIMDVNTTDALCIDLDNGVSTYSGLEDLLLVDSFILRAETPSGLIAGAKKQRRLVAEFVDSDGQWEDKGKRQKMIDSSKKYGDLRQRRVIISELKYGDIDIFYTQALGGVYVLKKPSVDEQQETVYVICKNPEQVNNFKGMDDLDVQVLPINKKHLLRELRRADFFQADMKVYQENPELLAYKKELLLANVICAKEESYSGWSEMRKKNFIARHGDEMPPLFFDLERVQKRLAAGKKFYEILPVSPDLIAYLTMPHRRMPAIYRTALESLLSELDPTDPFRLFKYNKQRFYEEYKQYPACKKAWVAERLELELAGE
ncbi:MAG: hypothetical protein D3909_12480 [Candidatus Electrothrix sp. ATG1]|nr:hypothetical protein [Candidatus Electrothrix sp. ATG1]